MTTPIYSPLRLLLFLALLMGALLPPANAQTLRQTFVAPPDAARPWVYWFVMDGNMTREGIHADFEAMKKAGIGGVIFMDVDIGIPRGPVSYLSPEWHQLFQYSVSEAKRLGLQIALETGAGWCGTGGPWVTPELSMQHLVASTVSASGPAHFDAVLPHPSPRLPYFGEGTLSEDLRRKWADFYQDTALLAFPTPAGSARIEDTDHKALYYRDPYSSHPGTPPRIPAPANFAPTPADQTISPDKIVDLTGKLTPDGRLTWEVPAGNWTIMRFGRTLTGQTTRPAPAAGLGFESDKFSRPALAAHLHSYVQPILQELGPDYRSGDSGLTMLHFDSWEMGAQNWSPGFQQEFMARCGYDPTPFLPAITGYVVGSRERSERFLWDLRHTASNLIVENHARPLAEYAHQHGLTFSLEPYDLNPSADLDLGGAADLPMGEFWSQGWAYPTEYSCFEAVSVGHTNGRRVIGAESFTANGGEGWHQYPGSMKNQLDWALCTGINKFVIHRYQHQPDLDKFPGMTMGPYGVHWERTQTWWDLVPAFHTYISRCSQMLRQGLPVADILYLTPEGAPQVFTPPASALTSGLPDKKGYSFDGCSPENLIAHASVRAGRIVFPDGMSYRLLVLPTWDTMTPELLGKIAQLVRLGAAVTGQPPRQSPSLKNYPACDQQVRDLAAQLWGKGRILLPTAGANVPLAAAKWIWFPEGSPASSAPVGARYFHNTLTLEPGRVITGAVAALAADNMFTLFVNGHRVGSGSDFGYPDSFTIKPWLKSGPNDIRITAVNNPITDMTQAAAPNPAGLIGAFAVTFADGSVQKLFTDSSWQAAQSPNGPQSLALELGPAGMGPWNLPIDSDSLYPAYSVTADILKRLGVAPDFSADAPLRYIHRRLSNGDMYFLANSSAKSIGTICTFRTAGRQPEWWNPLTGETRDLPDSAQANGLTRLPVRLAPFESGFVLFLKPLARHAIAANFPQERTLMTLTRPWTVSFDPKWGGPAAVTFTSLDDWSKRPEPGIQYYSGKAVYTTSFDLPIGMKPSSLALGSVKNLASVQINGQPLGIVWCDPWRVKIPAGLLKPTGNHLQITVANLWINRLIGDSGLPQSRRLTWTTDNEYNPASPLEPSGLLGPVRLETAGYNNTL